MTVILPLFVKCCPCSHLCLMGRKYGSSKKDTSILFKGDKGTRGQGYLVNALVVLQPLLLSKCPICRCSCAAGTSQPLGPGMNSSSCSTSGDTLEMLMRLLVEFTIACLGDGMLRLL